MAIKFNQPVKHGAMQFIPGAALAFEDPDAEEYFIACGWADETDEDPAYTFSAGQVVVDPMTRDARTGQFVLPDYAQEVLDDNGGIPPLSPHERTFATSLIAPARED